MTLAQIAEPGSAGMIAILDKIARFVRTSGSQIDAQHGLNPSQTAPVYKFVSAKLVGFSAGPSEIQTGWPGVHGSDAVFPIVTGKKIPTGISHDGWPQLTHEIKDVSPEPMFVRSRMAGLKDSGVYTTPQMLDECAK